MSFKKPNMILASAKLNPSLINTFNLPLSVEAFDQFLEVQEILHSFIPGDADNNWSYIWGRAEYSSRKAYRHLSGSSQVHPSFLWIWKSCCQHKHKVFFWLLAYDRLSTRKILRRKNMHLQSYNCVLCNESVEETAVAHLFLKCDFAKACWNLVGLNIPHLQDPF
jgi:hypothetical protein